MSTITIIEVQLPDHWDEPGQVGEAFRAYDAHANRDNDARFGQGLIVRSPAERLAALRPGQAERILLFQARSADGLIGGMQVFLPQLESTDTVDLLVSAEPHLSEAGWLALTEALVAHAEALASAEGRTTLRAMTRGAASGPVTAATGFGGVDPAHPEAAPLVARGYAVEQVYRISVADLRELPDLDARLTATRSRAAAYEVFAWHGVTPGPHRRSMCALHEGMSVDAPGGGDLFDGEVWDDARLTDFEERLAAGGRTVRTVVASELASGDLVGFTSMFVGGGDVANQHDTYVQGAHRGHGLGMLLKLVNLAELRRHHPAHTRVLTWNAEENRPMLDVNEATGFRPVAYQAMWRRRVS